MKFYLDTTDARDNQIIIYGIKTIYPGATIVSNEDQLVEKD